MNTRKDKIGFIGLGIMGAPMATHLIKTGWDVIAFDIDKAKCSSLEESTNCVIARSPEEVMNLASRLITILPTSDHVEEVLFGKHGASTEIQSAITEKLKVTPAPTPRLHPNLSLIYKNKVANLIDALNNDDTITEANEAIRQLIETIRLVPFNGRLKIELFGELAALLNLGMARKNEHPLDNSKRVQVTVVAGAGFEPATFRL
jgi:hypothetical protein